jgi:hypothetical protein
MDRKVLKVFIAIVAAGLMFSFVLLRLSYLEKQARMTRIAEIEAQIKELREEVRLLEAKTKKAQ